MLYKIRDIKQDKFKKKKVLKKFVEKKYSTHKKIKNFIQYKLYGH